MREAHVISVDCWWIGCIRMLITHSVPHPFISELALCPTLKGAIQQEVRLMTNAFLSSLPFLPVCIWLELDLWGCNWLCACLLFLMDALGPDVFLISVDERAKHDQQFHSLSPTAGGFITGNTLTQTWVRGDRGMHNASVTCFIIGSVGNLLSRCQMS